MITENLSTLKIHKLTQSQYDRELEAGNIDENALYLTPDEAIDLSGYATAEQGAKADTAVQTVVGDTGLQATKSGTEVTIGFDPDVVFVFNCGSATELVD